MLVTNSLVWENKMFSSSLSQFSNFSLLLSDVICDDLPSVLYAVGWWQEGHPACKKPKTE